MKKGDIFEGIIETIEFPNKGILHMDGDRIVVKNAIPGQRIRAGVNKKRKGRCEARLLEVLEPSPLERQEGVCPKFGICGGCLYQSLPYEEQLAIKEQQVKGLLDGAVKNGVLKHMAVENAAANDGTAAPCDAADNGISGYEYVFEGIKGSPVSEGYRNKMEFSFGDEYRDGPLALGMHRRGSFYDIVTTPDCRIVHSDFCEILKATLAFFSEREISFYKKLQHTGYLRHLLVRRAVKTGEILVALVTSGQVEELETPGAAGAMKQQNLPEASRTDDVAEQQVSPEASRTDDVAEQQVSPEASGVAGQAAEQQLLAAWRDCLLELPLEGRFAGILHIRNDSLADVVQSDETTVLYGQEYFYEELLGLTFQISPFSFFQTNSLGAEVLYETARGYVGETKGKVVFDLYSGTGTIAQILAPVAEKVVGVEIVAEAVEAARENASRNGLSNCEFIAGDVLKVLDEVADKPDLIVLDPPRDGIHPKALDKIIGYGVERMVYISCKPTSLVRDLEILQQRGYRMVKACAVDMFPNTANIETVTLLTRAE